jgi:hypothetical protein
MARVWSPVHTGQPQMALMADEFEVGPFEVGPMLTPHLYEHTLTHLKLFHCLGFFCIRVDEPQPAARVFNVIGLELEPLR